MIKFLKQLRNKLISLLITLALAVAPTIGNTADLISRYVNPDSAGGDGTTANLSGATAAYITLNDCEAAEDGVIGDLAGDDKYLEINCATGGTADTETVNFDIGSWTTDATRYIKIIGDRTGNEWDTSKYHLITTSDHTIECSVNYIYFEKLQISIFSPDYDKLALICTGSATGGDNYVYGCIIKGPGSGGDSAGILCDDADMTYYIYNNFIIDMDSDGWYAGIRCSDGVMYAYNNTLIDCAGDTGFGIRQSGGTLTAINNIVDGSGNSWAYYGTFTDSNYNSTDGTDTSDGGAQSIQSATHPFTGGGDYSLTEAYPGIDNPGSGLYSDDIIGTVRASTWDIGAWEYAAGEPPAESVPMILILQ